MSGMAPCTELSPRALGQPVTVVQGQGPEPTRRIANGKPHRSCIRPAAGTDTLDQTRDRLRTDGALRSAQPSLPSCPRVQGRQSGDVPWSPAGPTLCALVVDGDHRVPSVTPTTAGHSVAQPTTMRSAAGCALALSGDRQQGAHWPVGAIRRAPAIDRHRQCAPRSRKASAHRRPWVAFNAAQGRGAHAAGGHSPMIARPFGDAHRPARGGASRCGREGGAAYHPDHSFVTRSPPWSGQRGRQTGRGRGLSPGSAPPSIAGKSPRVPLPGITTRRRATAGDAVQPISGGCSGGRR